jgi:hypothetical protein
MIRSEILSRVLRHCGVRDVDVAITEGLPLEDVRGARLHAGRNALDGTRRLKADGPTAAAHTRQREPFLDIDSLMRTNVSVCP